MASTMLSITLIGKFKVRLEIPQVYASDNSIFEKLCEGCQKKILTRLDNVLFLPTSITIESKSNTSSLIIDSSSLKIYLNHNPDFIEMCDKCSDAFREWLFSKNYLQFNDKPIQLLLSRIID